MSSVIFLVGSNPPRLVSYLETSLPSSFVHPVPLGKEVLAALVCKEKLDSLVSALNQVGFLFKALPEVFKNAYFFLGSILSSTCRTRAAVQKSISSSSASSDDFRRAVISYFNRLCILMFDVHKLVLFAAALYRAYRANDPLPLWFDSDDL